MTADRDFTGPSVRPSRRKIIGAPKNRAVEPAALLNSEPTQDTCPSPSQPDLGRSSASRLPNLKPVCWELSSNRGDQILWEGSVTILSEDPHMIPQTSVPPSQPLGADASSTLIRTGRVTALWYLGLAITGAIGFLLIRGSIYVDGDPGATATNLTENEGLARLGIGLDLGIVITQTVAALWFYRLFRHVDSFVAASLTALGLVNAVAIMIATAFSATALAVAIGATPAPGGDLAASAQLLYDLNDMTWSVGSVFFGLWLIPMGYLVLKSGTISATVG